MSTIDFSPLISVIIPVYNAEKYLSDCLNSVLKQDNQDFEIIIVDDGSTDKSPLICDDYAQKDSRFHIIHKKNEGVSIARNVALDISKGKYIAFIDADDNISTDFLSIPEEFKEIDVIQKSYNCIDANKKITKTTVQNHLFTKWNEIAYLWVNKPNRALWDKIISKRIIGNNRFIPGVAISEDFLFFTSILPNIKTYALSNIGHYNYYTRKNSAMSIFQKNPHERIRITFEHIKIIESLEKNNEMQKVCKSLLYGFFVHSLWETRSLLYKEEYVALTKLLGEMSFTDLKYLRPRWKIEMYIVRLKNLFYKHA